MYKQWLEGYKKYRDEARRFAVDNPEYTVLQTDISSYYPSIDQWVLMKKLYSSAGFHESRVNDLITRLIKRDCSLGCESKGIPQGHIASGAYANIYLSDIDAIFCNREDGLKYFRYVDDMTFIIPPMVKTDDILNLLDQKLSLLGLSRSEEKTKLMSAKKFILVTEPDQQIEGIAKDHNILLSELWKIDGDYIRLMLDDWWQFIEKYQLLLSSIGVFIPISLLSRKLQKNLRWWQRIARMFRSIKFPRIGSLQVMDDIDRWRKEFVDLNTQVEQGWLEKYSSLKNQLKTLFFDSLVYLDDESDQERAKAHTRIKFAIYRLGQLGFDNCLEDVIYLVENRPWLLNLRQVCRDMALQGHTSKLRETYQRLLVKEGDEWIYVRGVILKAFSMDTQSASPEILAFLSNAAYDSRTSRLEKTMASESLVLLSRNIGRINPPEGITYTIKELPCDYTKKNYILMGSKSEALSSSDEISICMSNRRVLNDTLHLVKNNRDLEPIFRYEPDILRERFYDSDYPDIPEEFHDSPYWL